MREGGALEAPRGFSRTQIPSARQLIPYAGAVAGGGDPAEVGFAHPLITAPGDGVVGGIAQRAGDEKSYLAPAPAGEGCEYLQDGVAFEMELAVAHDGIGLRSVGVDAGAGGQYAAVVGLQGQKVKAGVRVAGDDGPYRAGAEDADAIE